MKASWIADSPPAAADTNPAPDEPANWLSPRLGTVFRGDSGQPERSPRHGSAGSRERRPGFAAE